MNIEKFKERASEFGLLMGLHSKIRFIFEGFEGHISSAHAAIMLSSEIAALRKIIENSDFVKNEASGLGKKLIKNLDELAISAASLAEDD